MTQNEMNVVLELIKGNRLITRYLNAFDVYNSNFPYSLLLSPDDDSAYGIIIRESMNNVPWTEIEKILQKKFGAGRGMNYYPKMRRYYCRNLSYFWSWMDFEKAFAPYRGVALHQAFKPADRYEEYQINRCLSFGVVTVGELVDTLVKNPIPARKTTVGFSDRSSMCNNLLLKMLDDYLRRVCVNE